MDKDSGYDSGRSRGCFLQDLSGAMERMSEEVTCPICSNLMVEPVSTECGHNFCKECIFQVGRDRDSACPVCQRPFLLSNLQPNEELASKVDNLTQKGQSTKQGLQRHRCTFCEEFWNRLRRVCDQCPKCCFPCMGPTDKDAPNYERKVEMHKSRIHMEFKQQRTFLDNEEQKRLEKLQEDKKTQLRILEGIENQLSQQRRALQELISEPEQRSQDSALDMMQIRYITLDPETANPWLILSEDLRQVRLGDKCQESLDNDERFDCFPMVLGAQSFSSGKHHWKVDVTGKKAWDLGVCRDSVQRKGPFLLNPENGFWTIWLWDKQKYEAGTSPKTSLDLEVPPRQVGIFLDCDSGTVSFYNITDGGSLIYAFSECVFGGEPLRPFFNPDDGENTDPLKLCPLS
ncbi:PREDICTED: E3 ubiquitin-protein ligase TRIM21-like [Elephantulus edwardii]|uniref:E3 ubiquitin-protein ligase TRIM21-like n=1 Tax=Elephantulus edwardii TaxID=28737 RepID=UPI0003F09201|nr:PREDICTED: E3 ubiquitin-protein ligase TRIM21-like [Elephantulus edwardii]